MRLTPLLAMVRKDLLLFFGDRRSVILSFVVPIAIASFFGSIFPGAASDEPARIDVALIDHDNSAISKSIVASVKTDANLRLVTVTESEARDAVQQGNTSVVVVIPEGFGNSARRAFLNLAPQPQLQLLYDPSHRMELAMVRGILTQHVMQAASSAMFDSPGSGLPRGGLRMPYTVKEVAVTSGPDVAYNGYAHSFGGMGVQFLLFAMANLGVEMLLERQRGLWKRLRSAPLSRMTLLGGKVVSGTVISLMTLWVSFAFAMIVFGVRIHGSVLGFIGVSLATALMAATFGLLVAAIGRTPASARAVTTLAVLMMVMLGGAWVPAFIFPQWLQQASKAVPVRWSVDGLDAMTWRGLGFSGAVVPILVLLGFAALFGVVAARRFRWEEA